MIFVIFLVNRGKFDSSIPFSCDLNMSKQNHKGVLWGTLDKREGPGSQKRRLNSMVWYGAPSLVKTRSNRAPKFGNCLGGSLIFLDLLSTVGFFVGCNYSQMAN